MMRAFWAIVADTWRLSRKQVVFVILLVIMLLLAIGMVGIFRVTTDDEGNKQFRFIGSENNSNAGIEMWLEGYSRFEVFEDSSQRPKKDAGDEEWEKFIEAQEQRKAEFAEKRSGLDRFELWVIGWHFLAQVIMVTISMWLFIAAAAGYFPGLMEAGCIDVVLSKPRSRLLIFCGRFVGGLMFLAGAILAFQVIMVVGMGIRTGIWHTGLFLSIFPIMFTAALLFSVLALLGIMSRSTVLALVVGYFLYLAVDSVLAILFMQQSMGELEWAWLDSLTSALRDWVPNFSNLKSLATLSALEIPDFDWQPFYVGGGWFVAAIGAAYWIFRRRDF